MSKIRFFTAFLILVLLVSACSDKTKNNATKELSQTRSGSFSLDTAKEDGTPKDEQEVNEEADSKEASKEIVQEIADLNITAWTTDTVNFRSEPDTVSQVIKKISRRTEILILQDLGDWKKVSFAGDIGFIASDYITTEEPKGNGKIVCIDPGHQLNGDSTPEPNGPGSSTTKARVTSGTTGRTTGVPEYQLNLDVALKLRDELEARGYTVVMTRETHDVNISNMERAQFATNAGADITVRIHANGSDNTAVSGALTMAPTTSNPYVSGIAEESGRLSNSIINEYCAVTGMNNQGVIKTDTMTGINWCTMPVTIVEMGYMTNANDDANMQNAEFQNKMVMGIANGIDKYFMM